MRIDRWNGNDLETLDTEQVWLETFATWDALTDTDTAADIATATVRALVDGTIRHDQARIDEIYAKIAKLSA